MKGIIFVLVVITARQIYSQSQSDVVIDKFLNSLKEYAAQNNRNLQLPDDVGLNISEYLNKYNYPLESHEVITEDGFILSLHRIPAGRGKMIPDSAEVRKPAALFIHGLLCSGMDWVTLGYNKSLSLLMADIGYDIWLLNTRGTRYSMNHQTLNSSDSAFWDFSFHEKGYYDVAASIDYVLQSTGLEKLTLIGHSEGTSDMMALTTTRPEYNDKINLAVLLSPIGYMGGVRSPIPLFLVKYMTEIRLIFSLLNIHGVSYSETFSKIIVAVCSTDAFQDVCVDLVQSLCGYDLEQVDMDYYMVFLGDKITGGSVKELVHYGQEIKAASFAQYDYGTLENLLRYGSSTPPAYDASKITTPVAYYYGKNDFFAGVSDVEKLVDQMPNIVDAYLIEYENFNHIDFISAKDIKTLLYDRVISIIDKYNPVINN